MSGSEGVTQEISHSRGDRGCPCHIVPCEPRIKVSLAARTLLLWNILPQLLHRLGRSPWAVLLLIFGSFPPAVDILCGYLLAGFTLSLFLPSPCFLIRVSSKLVYVSSTLPSASLDPRILPHFPRLQATNISRTTPMEAVRGTAPLLSKMPPVFPTLSPFTLLYKI